MGAGATIDDAAADAVKQVMEATAAEAKSGMIAFSRSLALEEARHGITVNVVNPPIMDDKDLTLEEAVRIADARFPAGRPGSTRYGRSAS